MIIAKILSSIVVKEQNMIQLSIFAEHDNYSFVQCLHQILVSVYFFSSILLITLPRYSPMMTKTVYFSNTIRVAPSITMMVVYTFLFMKRKSERTSFWWIIPACHCWWTASTDDCIHFTHLSTFTKKYQIWYNKDYDRINVNKNESGSK